MQTSVDVNGICWLTDTHLRHGMSPKEAGTTTASGTHLAVAALLAHPLHDVLAVLDMAVDHTEVELIGVALSGRLLRNSIKHERNKSTPPSGRE